MLIIRGVNVFPSQIEAVLMELDGVGMSYEIVVDRANFMDTIEVRVEITDTGLLRDYGLLEALRAKIRRKLREVVQLDINVKLVEPMSITRFEGKAKRVRDLRAGIAAAEHK
jgi:phenylacetate-CoA ligase